MTAKKKTDKGAGKKIKLKKETLRDLEPRGAVKGGARAKTERTCGPDCFSARCLP